jgi:hypothetical protein
VWGECDESVAFLIDYPLGKSRGGGNLNADSVKNPKLIPMKKTILALALVAGITLFDKEVSAQTVAYTYGTGDGSIPGGFGSLSTNNLLQSSLASTTIIGDNGSDSFYRESSGYAVDISRLYSGYLGPLSSDGLGSDGRFCVFPNKVTLQFNLNVFNTPQGFALEAIKTYASWDEGRSGQGYTVKYSTVDNPSHFSLLYTVTPWNNTNFPTSQSYQYDYDINDYVLVTNTDTSSSTTLTFITNSTGKIANNVASVQFVFNGYQNGGTAYRQFQVVGAADAVPEPSTYALFGIGAIGLLMVLRRKKTA